MTLDAILAELRAMLRDPATLDDHDLARQVGIHEAIEAVHRVGRNGSAARSETGAAEWYPYRYCSDP